LISWKANTEDEKEKIQARKVLDVTLAILASPNNKEGRIGLNVKEDWDSALNLLKQYSELKTDMTADQFYTNEFLPDA
jgi:NitT/TauT family transport system substrate-binding protein